MLVLLRKSLSNLLFKIMSDDFPTEVNPYELSARMVSLEEKLLAAIQIINNNQDKIGDDVAKIKEAVYNPDEGLYARLRGLEQKLAGLEEWKAASTKFTWIIVTSIVGLFLATLWRALMPL